jgi:putative tryptophan/tyrosine transport system substrate-binding protein
LSVAQQPHGRSRRAQQPSKLPIIGFLGGATASAWTNWLAAFVQRLRELGWSEGRTVSIEYRWAEGRHERAAEIAAEFVRLKVDVIVTSGGVLSAVRQATSTIPIVFAVANDPIGAGFVSSLARPGGNITGLSLQTRDLAAKRLELLREIAPGIRRFGILANIGNDAAVPEIDEVQAAARILGLEVVTSEIRQAEDITSAFAAFGSDVEALYVCTDPLVLAQRARINTLALTARLPAIYGPRERARIIEFSKQRQLLLASGFGPWAREGAFLSYGPDTDASTKRAAAYVDKILRGAKPDELPIEQPTKFQLVINGKTANSLSLDIPPSLLATADQVIE